LLSLLAVVLSYQGDDRVVANQVDEYSSEIRPYVNLVESGVDSLLGLELRAEIKAAFDCTPDEVAMISATTIRDLLKCLPIPVDILRQDEMPAASRFLFW
jgi:hypothetical protein